MIPPEPGDSRNAPAHESGRTLATRLITGFVAGPIVIGLVMLGGLPFAALIVIGGVLAIAEFATILRQSPSLPGAAAVGWWAGSLVYLTGALIALIAIRWSADGLRWLLVLLIANWGTDSFAYIVGRWLGRRPLAPQISPNKTVEGALGGSLCGALIALIGAALLRLPIGVAVAIALLVPIATTLGDLIESAFKRQFNVKQSGHLLPGHGGVLDRIDGLLLAAWVVGLVWLLAER